jgi:hypothetical protein
VSPNEANFDLRETFPLSRNILHNREGKAHEYTGQRMSRKILPYSTGYQDWSSICTSPKVSADYLNYPADIRDTAKSGIGCTGNRHLHCLVEFIFVNVGGSQQNAKASSLPMTVESVGGVIVVGGRESLLHGEGRQGINASRLESNSEFEESQTGRKARRYEIERK